MFNYKNATKTTYKLNVYLFRCQRTTVVLLDYNKTCLAFLDIEAYTAYIYMYNI